jgi:hypothetical protein
MLAIQEPRNEIKWFMFEMKKSLDWNQPIKGDSWQKCLPSYFMQKIKRKSEDLLLRQSEGGEFRDANVIRICTDIANYCMMLADNTRRRNETPF